MNPEAQKHLDDFVAKYKESAPSTWVRIVVWWAYLGENGKTDRGSAIHPQTAVVFEGGTLEQRSFRANAQASFDLQDMTAALAGEPEEGWTLLKIEIDRDGTVRTDFDTGPARDLEDSATDPYWDHVHDYLSRNRPALEQLVDRLRTKDQLPDPDAVSEVDPMTLPPSQRPKATPATQAASPAEPKGRFGRFFGRG